MSNSLEIASLLIDEFHSLINMLPRYIDLDKHKEIYKIIFEIFYQAVNRRTLLLKNLCKDVRLSRILQHVRRTLNIVSGIIDRRVANIQTLAHEMLRRAYIVLAEVPENTPKYVIVCDGLSIVDAVYIAFRLKKENMEPFVAPLINPGGITETYKFILEPRSYLQYGNLTLNVIAHSIAKKICAKDAIVFRGYDDYIHRLRNIHAVNIINTMYSLTSKLYSKIAWMKSEFNGMIMLLSDHGYDVIAEDVNMCKVEHCWRPRALSVIASLLVV